MSMKDNPDYVTTKEIMDALECGRTNVQKLEAAKKLHRAGVEGNRVYYQRHEMEALLDEKAYPSVPEPKHYEAPSTYTTSQSWLDVEFRKMERAYLHRGDAAKQSVQDNGMTGVIDAVNQIRNDMIARERKREETERQARWKAAQQEPDWVGRLIIAGTVAAIGYTWWTSPKTVSTVTTHAPTYDPLVGREFVLRIKILCETATPEEFDEYVGIRWAMEFPCREWRFVTGDHRLEYTLSVKISLGIGTEDDKKEHAWIRWVRRHPEDSILEQGGDGQGAPA